MLHRNLNIYQMLQNIRTTEQTVEARATVCAAISPNAPKQTCQAATGHHTDHGLFLKLPATGHHAQNVCSAIRIMPNKRQHHAAAPPHHGRRPKTRRGKAAATPAAALTASRALLPHPAAPPVFAVALPRKSGHGHTGQRPLLHSLVMSSSVLPLVSGTSFQTKNAAITHITP